MASLQHIEQGETLKAWLKRKLRLNEPFCLDEIVAGQKVYRAIGYERKRSAQGNLTGHRHCHQSPVVPRDHWWEEGLALQRQLDNALVPCYLSCHGFKLLLTVAPGALGQAWREYLVASERELREINHATDRRELTGEQTHSARALFDNGFNGKETSIAKGAMIQGLHAQKRSTIQNAISQQKRLKGKTKNINIHDHASPKTLRHHRLANAALAVLADEYAGAADPAVLGSRAAAMTVKMISEASGGAATEIRNGREVLPFEIQPGPAMSGARCDRLSNREKKQQQLLLDC